MVREIKEFKVGDKIIVTQTYGPHISGGMFSKGHIGVVTRVRRNYTHDYTGYLIDDEISCWYDGASIRLYKPKFIGGD